MDTCISMFVIVMSSLQTDIINIECPSLSAVIYCFKILLNISISAPVLWLFFACYISCHYFSRIWSMALYTVYNWIFHIFLSRLITCLLGCLIHLYLMSLLTSLDLHLLFYFSFSMHLLSFYIPPLLLCFASRTF